MKLSSLLRPNLIRCGLTTANKQDTLAELVRVLVAADPSVTEAEIQQALADREKLGPFSMGKGVGFPHARTEKVKDFTVVLGTSRAGIDFRAPDGHKIRIVVLFVIPKKHSNLYLHALAAFLNFFGVEENLRRVAEAGSPEEALRLIDALSSKGSEGASAELATPAVLNRASLKKAVDALLAARAEALPVVDAEGHLVGEITAAGVLELGLKEAAPPEQALQSALRKYAEHPVESISGLVNANGFRTIQEDEPVGAIASRLARTPGRGVYVLRGKRLVGALGSAELLRKLGFRTE